MRALMYLGTRQMEMQEVSRNPVNSPGHVVLRVGAASICGSDLHGFLGKSAKRVPPLIMGHEFTGEIVDLGPGVDGVSIGDRVTVNPILYVRPVRGVPARTYQYLSEQNGHRH